jgi:hypothetical protein
LVWLDFQWSGSSTATHGGESREQRARRISADRITAVVCVFHNGSSQRDPSLPENEAVGNIWTRGTESREQRAESREQRAITQEQRGTGRQVTEAKQKEAHFSQVAERREQRAEMHRRQ